MSLLGINIIDFMTRDYLIYSGDGTNFDFAELTDVPKRGTYASAKNNLLDIVEPLDKTLIIPNLQTFSMNYTCEESSATIIGSFDTYVIGKFRCIRGSVNLSCPSEGAGNYYYLTFPKDLFSYKNVTVEGIGQGATYQKVKLLSMLYTKSPKYGYTILSNVSRNINEQFALRPIGNTGLTEPRFYFYVNTDPAFFTMRFTIVSYAA